MCVCVCVCARMRAGVYWCLWVGGCGWDGGYECGRVIECNMFFFISNNH